MGYRYSSVTYLGWQVDGERLLAYLKQNLAGTCGGEYTINKNGKVRIVSRDYSKKPRVDEEGEDSEGSEEEDSEDEDGYEQCICVGCFREGVVPEGVYLAKASPWPDCDEEHRAYMVSLIPDDVRMNSTLDDVKAIKPETVEAAREFARKFELEDDPVDKGPHLCSVAEIH